MLVGLIITGHSSSEQPRANRISMQYYQRWETVDAEDFYVADDTLRVALDSCLEVWKHSL